MGSSTAHNATGPRGLLQGQPFTYAGCNTDLYLFNDAICASFHLARNDNLTVKNEYEWMQK
jgi:hypothetical protein